MLKAIDMHTHIFTGDRAKQPLAKTGVPSASCIRLSLPVIFHTGTTAIAAGTPGGGGLLRRQFAKRADVC